MRSFYLTVFLLLSLNAPTQAERILYDQPVVNDHAGYLSAWSVNNGLNKVLLIVPGFDTKNDSLPVDKLFGDFAPVTWYMGILGWDVIYFEYVDGATDLRDNADNLARFIEYLDSQAPADYHLAVLGGSMGGIVTRTLFVQENSSMGVDSYVSVDSPHWGVYLSDWAVDLATLAIDDFAAHQMHHGDPLYDELYGWLREVETSEDFRQRVNNPMNTCAIALSDATNGSWKVRWSDLLTHNKYYPVSSYVEVSGLRSTYMPYHSSVYLNSTSTKKSSRWGYNSYRYRSLASDYFDQTIANPRDEHAAPEYAIAQALRFILDHGPS